MSHRVVFDADLVRRYDLAGPRYVYSSATQGSYTRVDVIAGTKRPIGPSAPPGESYRFDWSARLACKVFKPKRMRNGCFTRYDVKYRVVGKVKLKRWVRRHR